MIIDENSEMTQISKARNGGIARIRKCSPMKWGTPPHKYRSEIRFSDVAKLFIGAREQNRG